MRPGMACILQFEALRHWVKKRPKLTNLERFSMNQWGCGEIDFTVEFRASNMPKYPLEGSSNRRERPGEGDFKTEKWVRFWLQGMNHWRYGKTDGTIGFSASNRCIYPLEGGFDCR